MRHSLQRIAVRRPIRIAQKGHKCLSMSHNKFIHSVEPQRSVLPLTSRLSYGEEVAISWTAENGINCGRNDLDPPVDVWVMELVQPEYIFIRRQTRENIRLFPSVISPGLQAHKKICTFHLFDINLFLADSLLRLCLD